MPSSPPRHSLHLLLTAPFVVIVGLAVAAVSGLLLDAGRRSVDSLSAELWRGVANEVTHYLDEFLGKPERVSQDIAHVISDGLIDADQRQALLRYLAYPMQHDPALTVAGVGRVDGQVTAVSRDDKGGPLVALVTEADAPGQLVRRVLRLDATLGAVERADDYVLQDRPWFQLGLREGTSWTEPYHDYTTDALLLSAVHPTRHPQNGMIDGVVSVAISMQTLSDFLASIEAARDGVVFVSDEHGQVLASSRRGPAGGGQAPLIEATLAALGDQADGINTASATRLVIDGGDHLVHVAPFGDGNGLDWRVITSVPEAVYIGQIQASWRLSFALALLALLLALSAGAVVSRRVVGPLARLSHAARQVAADDVDSEDIALPELARVGSREVGQLHLALGQMTSRLREAFSQQELLNVALGHSEQQLRQTLESLPVGAMLHDAEQRLIFINAVALDLLGLPGDRELPGPVDTLPTDAQDALRRIEEAVIAPALAGRSTHVECLELPRCGTSLPVELWSSPVVDDERKVVLAVSALQDVSERQRAEARLIHHAMHDSLTGLANRNQLTTRINLAISRMRRDGDRHFALLFLDLDDFKVVNDSLGHLVGDEVLIEVSRRLSILSRETDLAARLGGDEFVLLLEDLEDSEQALAVADRVFAALSDTVTVGDREVRVGTSIGLVHGDELYEEAADLLRDADIALYRAKADGRGYCAVFDASMRDRAMRRQRLEEDLRLALRSDNLSLHFQPIVDLTSGEVISFEALCRWQHPLLGSVSPMEFVSLAEETGLIVALDRWVIRSACRTIARWRDSHRELQIPRVCVNLSNHDVSCSDLVAYIDETLKAFELPATALGVELTESGLVKDLDHTRETFKALRDRGITIAIDDFGTGYSSLSYLYRLPVDALKIDRSLVSGLTRGATNHKIVSSVVALSNELGINAVAEGIEEESELTLLRSMGCELAQGYYFARPMPASEVPGLLSGAGAVRLEAVLTSAP